MNRYFGLHILEGEWHSLLPRYLLLADRVGGRRVLDIGCGSGIGASLLLELGASMVDAIDHRPAVLELARMKHAKQGLDFHVMFWEELDFPDDTFDVVLCLDPSSPVTDPSLLEEVGRVLKPGGEYICAIERKPLDGLERLLPRYGYADAAESIELHGSSERPPQVGELQKHFERSASVVQRPRLSFVFEPADSDDGTPPIDDHLRQRDDDDAAVEIWFCGDEALAPPPTRNVRLPYFSLVQRLDQVINELQMRQIRGHHEAEPIFDEILDDGPSEVYERERESTNEYRVVNLEDTPTRTHIRALRDDLAVEDHPTLVRHEAYGSGYPDGLESQLAELSALYQQVRHEFQSVVFDAQTALEERDRYIEHLVGKVQHWQERFGPDLGNEGDLDEGTTAFHGRDEPDDEQPASDEDEPDGADPVASDDDDAAEAENGAAEQAEHDGEDSPALDDDGAADSSEQDDREAADRRSEEE